MKITIKKLRKINTLEELEKLENELGGLEYEVGSRGGSIGFFGKNIALYLGIEEWLLPRKVGAFCNYLGGGVRGSIVTSDYSDEIPEKEASWIEELCLACARVYEKLEKDVITGDKWGEMATNTARAEGIVSAY